MTTAPHYRVHRSLAAALALLSLLQGVLAVAADDAKQDPPSGVQPHVHHIQGLFCAEREADLRTIIAELPDIEFVSADYKHATATFKYDEAKLFPGAKPNQVIERLDNMIGNATRHTFRIKPARTIPDDKLTKVEVKATGLHCMACSYGTYVNIIRIEGVEVATADLRASLVTALIDPVKTNRDALIEKLKQIGLDAE